MGLTITYMGATTAATGATLDNLPCKVTLASPLPSWPAGVENNAVAFAIGWYDDVNGEDIEMQGATILGLNHMEQILELSPIIMPSGNLSGKVAIFRPSTDAEYAQGKNWVRTTITASFTITNTGSGGSSSGGSTTSFTCYVCDKVFTSQALLDAHIESVHGGVLDTGEGDTDSDIDNANFLSKYKWYLVGGAALAALIGGVVILKKKSKRSKK